MVVNDIDADYGHDGRALVPAERVVEEIIADGGEAVATAAAVVDYQQAESMVAETLRRWGRVDILVNNARMISDRNFPKTDLEVFLAVENVHLTGSFNCAKAVWDEMRKTRYGRIVMTTSPCRLGGGFGQANYAAAKLALAGFMQTLGLEGAKDNIHVNCLDPDSTARSLDARLPKEIADRFVLEMSHHGLLALVDEYAPNRMILCAESGSFEPAVAWLTKGVFVGGVEDPAEEILAGLNELSRNVWGVRDRGSYSRGVATV